MVTFLELPQEIRLLIAEYLDPRSYLHLGETCHALASLLAKGIAEWADLSRVHQLKSLSDEDVWHVFWLANSDPKVAASIRHIEAYQMQPFYDTAVETSSISISDEALIQRPPRDIVDKILKLIKQNTALSRAEGPGIPSKGPAWSPIKCSEIGVCDIALVSLVLLCENVQTLKWRWEHERIYGHLQALFSYTYECYRTTESCSWINLPFQSLTAIDIISPGWHDFIPLSVLTILLPLPSLRILLAKGMGCPPEDDLAEIRMSKSNVKTLKFYGSYIPPRHMATVLSSIESLEHFYFHHGFHNTASYNASYVEALRISASTSLRCLEIELYNDGSRPRPSAFCKEQSSFQEFERLSTLRCSMQDLYPEIRQQEESQRNSPASAQSGPSLPVLTETGGETLRSHTLPSHRLVDALPIALESLTLEYVEPHNYRHIESFLCEDVDKTSKLKELFTDTKDDEIYNLLAEECRRHGIKYDFRESLWM